MTKSAERIGIQMKKRNKFLAFVIGLFRFILIAALLCSLFATTASVYLKQVLFDKQFYRDQLTDDTYINEIYGFISKDVKSSSLYYGLPYDDLMAVITVDSVKELSASYSDAMYESLTTGEEMAQTEYSSAAINGVLKEYFVKENYDVTDDTVKLIADDLAATISASVVVLKGSYGNVQIFKPLSKYVFTNKILVFCSNISGWMIAACSVLTLLTLFLSASFKAGLYNVANVYWLAGCIMFIPIYFLKNHDIISKIAISESPMKSFVGILGNPAIEKLLNITQIVFIIACVILAIAIAVYIISLILKYKNKGNGEEPDGSEVSVKATDEAADNIKPEDIPQVNPEQAAAKEPKQTAAEEPEQHEEVQPAIISDQEADGTENR